MYLFAFGELASSYSVKCCQTRSCIGYGSTGTCLQPMKSWSTELDASLQEGPEAEIFLPLGLVCQIWGYYPPEESSTVATTRILPLISQETSRILLLISQETSRIPPEISQAAIRVTTRACRGKPLHPWQFQALSSPREAQALRGVQPLPRPAGERIPLQLPTSTSTMEVASRCHCQRDRECRLRRGIRRVLLVHHRTGVWASRGWRFRASQGWVWKAQASKR